VVSPENLGHPFHVYPFDTGAAVKGIYQEKVVPGDFLEDFALRSDLNSIKQHIKWAFGDNSSYFDGNLKNDLDLSIDEWKTTAKGFVRIAGLAGTATNDPDQRAAAVEVAYARHIPIRGNVRAVIVPKQFIENSKTQVANDEFLSALKNHGIDYKIYDWRPSETPNYYLDEIRLIMKNYLKI